MLIQMHLSPADRRAAKAYRLQVKERLYRFNYVSVVISLFVMHVGDSLLGMWG